MDPGFWKGKRVLITGHTGFKGGWLSLWLQSWGAHVVGYSLKAPTEPSFFEVCRVADGMISTEGDVCNLGNLRSVVTEHSPEIVFHMAAQSLVRHSYQHPVETFATNVMGTLHVFEAARHSGSARVIVNITSDKCYENREWVWGYRESDPMGGYDLYSSSKGCAELLTAAYRRSYFNADTDKNTAVSLASARAGNVIGGGDWATDRLVPDIMRAIAQRQAVAIRNPHGVRPWQHVLEPLSGYLLLAQRLWEDGKTHAEGWNFGPDDNDVRPVSWIADFLTKHWGDGATWRHDNSEHPHEADYLKLDCSKARSRLKWRPRWNISRALERVVDWHKAHISGKDMHEVSLVQIREYLHDAEKRSEYS